MDDADALERILTLFERECVEFIFIGGTAAILHGASYVTEDVDFCCPRDRTTLTHIATALNSLNPRFRVEGVVTGVSVALDARTLQAGDAVSFISDLGYIDIRFSVNGIGLYSDVLALSEVVDFESRSIRLLTLEGPAFRKPLIVSTGWSNRRCGGRRRVSCKRCRALGNPNRPRDSVDVVSVASRVRDGSVTSC